MHHVTYNNTNLKMVLYHNSAYRHVSNIRRTKSQHFLVLSCGCLCRIPWSQMLSRQWRCSWSSADRSEWSTILLPTKVRLILEVLRCLSNELPIHNHPNKIIPGYTKLVARASKTLPGPMFLNTTDAIWLHVFMNRTNKDLRLNGYIFNYNNTRLPRFAKKKPSKTYL